VLHDFVHVDIEDEDQPLKIHKIRMKNKKIPTSFVIASSAESSGNEIFF
jgi:hypothetical protein